MDWVDRPKKCKGFYGILQLLQGSHLDNFSLKTLKLGWVAFHPWTDQLKCLDFLSNKYKKLAPVLSRFCNGLLFDDKKNSRLYPLFERVLWCLIVVVKTLKDVKQLITHCKTFCFVWMVIKHVWYGLALSTTPTYLVTKLRFDRACSPNISYPFGQGLKNSISASCAFFMS